MSNDWKRKVLMEMVRSYTRKCTSQHCNSSFTNRRRRRMWIIACKSIIRKKKAANIPSSFHWLYQLQNFQATGNRVGRSTCHVLLHLANSWYSSPLLYTRNFYDPQLGHVWHIHPDQALAEPSLYIYVNRHYF